MSEQVRQSVLVASTLIDEYKVVFGRYLHAWKTDEAMDLHRADLERVYAGIWENVVGSREVAKGTEHTFRLAVEHNTQGIALARDGAAALRGFFSRLFGKR